MFEIFLHATLIAESEILGERVFIVFDDSEFELTSEIYSGFFLTFSAFFFELDALHSAGTESFTQIHLFELLLTSIPEFVAFARRTLKAFGTSPHHIGDVFELRLQT